MSTSTQLSFTLSTSAKVKTAHLLGSWDNYKQQLPLSCKEKAGKWKGTFSFKSTMIKPGSRYWYYVSLSLASDCSLLTLTTMVTVSYRWLPCNP